jgi:hypothetical protein
MKQSQWFLNIHPFFFGVYPAAALLGHNIAQVYRLDVLRPFLMMVGVTGFFWGCFWLIYRDWVRAAFVTSFFMFLFLFYENLYTLVRDIKLFSILINRHWILLPIFGIIAFFGLRGLRKGMEKPVCLAQIFFTIGLVAVFFPVYQIVSFDFESRIAHASIGEIVTANPPKIIGDDFPDIYFIVLDAYARDDILDEVYEFDNSPFLTELEKMGFYIPTCNQSNYSKTAFSIGSTLNLNYLDVLGGGDAKVAARRKHLIRDNEVRELLSQWGYKTVAFPTGLFWSVMDNADVFLTPEQDNLRKIGPWEPFGEINPFEALLLQTSFHSILDLLTLSGITIPKHEGSLASAIENDVDRQRFDRVHFALDALEKIPYIPGPKFVYAHIVSPHPPYLMNRDGEFSLELKGKKDGYIEQIMYLNNRILNILRTILDHSKTPPIIILEGDHGTKRIEWTPDIVKNLSAYYFPEGGNERLYNTMTPVNSFRIIFDYYFGTEFGNVEDLSYRSLSDDHQLDFEMVPNTCTRERIHR